MHRLILSLVLLTVSGHSQEEAKIVVHMPNNDVRAALAYYQRLTGKPTYLSLDIVKANTIVFGGQLSKADAAKVIEKSLLERNGIALRQIPSGEVLAEWSKDPAYPKSAEPRALPGDEDNAKRLQRVR